ncbi:MAG: DNA polymerase III subunit chi [Gammaproteobacteria bacterium]
MPEASFYLLDNPSVQQRNLFACKLIEKAYRGGFFCYVQTESDEQSRLIDDLLWSFRAGSFIPHQTYSGAVPDFEQVVLIGSSAPPEKWQTNLINLSLHGPPAFDQADRILEILENNDEVREAGRKRYRQYQQAGFKITTHDIKN